MANTDSAKKRALQNEKRRMLNKTRRSKIRTYHKKAMLAVAAGDHAIAMENFKIFQSEIARSVGKGLYHKNTAARLVSRLNKKIKALVVTTEVVRAEA